MQQAAEFLLAIGGILLLGMATDYLGKRTLLPRVTLLLILGIVVGDEVLGIVPASVVGRFDVIAAVTLMMVGFLLGGKLTTELFRRSGRELIIVSLAAAIGVAAFVSMVLLALGVDRELAILLGCIAAATDPAATSDTAIEYGGDTPFARLLIAIVAVDDLWGLLIFSGGLAFLSIANGDGMTAATLLQVGWEVGGALLLGAGIGLPAAYLTGRLLAGKPILTEALGLVLTCGAAAILMDVSYLIASMVMGAVISNLAHHHDYPFHAIEDVEWPFMVVFFVLAGASLEIDALLSLGLLGGGYVLSRIVGKIAGAWLGGSLAGSSRAVKSWLGLALLPQAGVAIGMALVAATRFPEQRQTILSVAISTTVLFELLGPVLTRLALIKAANQPD